MTPSCKGKVLKWSLQKKEQHTALYLNIGHFKDFFFARVYPDGISSAFIITNMNPNYNSLAIILVIIFRVLNI